VRQPQGVARRLGNPGRRPARECRRGRRHPRTMGKRSPITI